jgi:sugar transferase (PEP-CTERM/EpsH1 system associated)
MSRKKPLVAHIIYRLDTGGMENGLVNLINNMSDEFCSHAIICLTGFTDFRRRIQKSDVRIYALNKEPGHDLGVHFRLWKLLRNIRPDIVHTRNLAALEMNIVALLAGVRARIHGEHGRDIYDLDGSNWKYRLVRRLCQYFVNRYITVSKDLYHWLVKDIGIPECKVTQIYNGVDTQQFISVNRDQCREKYPQGFNSSNNFIIGTVGRLQPVKNQQYLIKALAGVLRFNPELASYLRVVVVGDGDCMQQLRDLAEAEGVVQFCWFSGDRSDVPALLGGFDLFVLPSMAEGISNTILEAMAMGLPVIATDVGGNPELVEKNLTGMLIGVDQTDELKSALLQYVRNSALRELHGINARNRVVRTFSLENMVGSYRMIYERCLS